MLRNQHREKLILIDFIKIEIYRLYYSRLAVFPGPLPEKYFHENRHESGIIPPEKFIKQKEYMNSHTSINYHHGEREVSGIAFNPGSMALQPKCHFFRRSKTSSPNP
ncbi:TPA: hypothetical protein HA351_06625 [Methanosarcinaceae archaeon]|nr:hypothetical protein [Methanosarcinaceae archaeon]